MYTRLKLWYDHDDVGSAITKLKKLQGDYSESIEIFQADHTQTDRFSTIISGGFALINCVGPDNKYGTQILEMTIKSGLHYFDLNAGQEYKRNIIKYDSLAVENGVMIGSGFGFYPGVSGLFIDKVCKGISSIEGCKICLYQPMHQNENDGKASKIGAVLELAYVNACLSSEDFFKRNENILK